MVKRKSSSAFDLAGLSSCLGLALPGAHAIYPRHGVQAILFDILLYKIHYEWPHTFNRTLQVNGDELSATLIRYACF